MTQHTPGPWIVASKESGHDVHYEGWLVTSEGGDIAQAINPYETFSFDKPELFAKGELIQQANARLIAAAPELLEALEAINSLQLNADRYDSKIKAFEVWGLKIGSVAKAAITKAIR